MRGEAITKPCESCGALLTKTKTEQGQRKYWTCGLACANKLKIAAGLAHGWKTDPERGRKETRPCAECGEPVTRRLSQRLNAQFWTCSAPCRMTYVMRERMAAGTWVQPRKPRTGTPEHCLICDKEFYRTPTAIRAGIGFYCSKACRDVAQRKESVIKDCERCGKEMVLKPSQAAIKHCSLGCRSLDSIKRPEERLHNGKPTKRDKAGYLMVWEPEHPNKSMKGWQYEHRLILEAKLGRYLTSDEQGDHINRDKSDNRPENLQALSQNDHARKSAAEWRADVAELKRKVAAYERLHGPLPEED